MVVRGGPAHWANLQPRGEPRHQSRVSPCRNGDAEPRVYVERDGPRLAEAILLRRRVAGTAGPKPRQLGPRVKDRQTLAAVSSPHIRPRRCSSEGQRGLGKCRQTQPEGAVGSQPARKRPQQPVEAAPEAATPTPGPVSGVGKTSRRRALFQFRVTFLTEAPTGHWPHTAVGLSCWLFWARKPGSQAPRPRRPLRVAGSRR